MNKLIPLALKEILHGDTGGLRDDASDVVGGDAVVQHLEAFLALRSRRLRGLLFPRKLLLQLGNGDVAQARCLWSR